MERGRKPFKGLHLIPSGPRSSSIAGFWSIHAAKKYQVGSEKLPIGHVIYSHPSSLIGFWMCVPNTSLFFEQCCCQSLAVCCHLSHSSLFASGTWAIFSFIPRRETWPNILGGTQGRSGFYSYFCYGAWLQTGIFPPFSSPITQHQCRVADL